MLIPPINFLQDHARKENIRGHLLSAPNAGAQRGVLMCKKYKSLRDTNHNDSLSLGTPGGSNKAPLQGYW